MNNGLKFFKILDDTFFKKYSHIDRLYLPGPTIFNL